jgi:hypothetical protein
MNLPPLSTSKYRHRDSRSHDPKKAGTEWYWKLSHDLPELWIRNAHELDAEKVGTLEAAWKKYVTLGVPGLGEGSGRSSRKWQNRAALKERYSKIDDEKVKEAREVALARYEHFVIDGANLKLDYHENKSDGKKCTRTSKNDGDAACSVM